MALDRSKFKATKVATMVAKDKEVESALGKTRGERADTLTIEEGKNKFRFYPPHPEDMGGGDVFAEPVVRCFLPMMVEEMKDGKPVMEGGRPKLKESAKPVFNSRIHGNTEKDLVEEYRKFAEKKAKDLYGEDSEKIEEYLTPIKGRFSKVASERIAGIQDRQTWVAYADKLTEDKDGNEKFKFGRIEFNVSVKTRLNKLSAMEGGDEPLGTDPFTDPEAGRAVIVDYNKAAKKASDYYTTEMDATTVRTEINGKFYPVQKEYPLSDEQLENYLKYPTLKSLFRGAFKRRDFELQMKGLEFFDNKYKMGIWEEAEWADIVEEIAGYYPEESNEDSDEEGDGPVTASKPTTTTTTSEDEEEEGDEFDAMSRDELKAYNKENSLGIIVNKALTDDKLRDAIRVAVAANSVTGEEEEEEESKDEETPQAKEDKKPSMAERLAALKAKKG